MITAVDGAALLQDLANALSLGCLYALLALGLALVYGVMGLLNWAHGELMMVGAYVLVVVGGAASIILIPSVILVVVIFALLMERVAFRPIRGAGAETMLITSFGVSVLLVNLAQMIFGGNTRTAAIPTSILAPVHIGSASVPRLDLVIITVAIAIVVALVLLLNRTRIGLELRAAAQDFEMARLLGVNANRVIAVAFALAGVLAAVAAYLYAAQTGVVTPTFGTTPVVIAFVAVILGGMGSLLGGATGGFVVGVLSVVLQVALPQALRPFRDAFLYALVFLMLALRPQGLVVPKHRIRRV